ncbi:hypothetical protein ACIF8W_04995 [Streptomyces sp. NPDC085639]|uniref:hypothetical protein n=1 Tax=Streptomyces sp. NPDC085639 TaxID=3365734 RepID=UPI0037CE9E62
MSGILRLRAPRETPGPEGLRVFEADGPVIGRTTDLARIDRFLAGWWRPDALLGEPGIGKTALLAAANARSSAGARTSWRPPPRRTGHT